MSAGDNEDDDDDDDEANGVSPLAGTDANGGG